jgi:DNA-binding transcriptional regulator LsrR (DeoR family)
MLHNDSILHYSGSAIEGQILCFCLLGFKINLCYTGVGKSPMVSKCTEAVSMHASDHRRMLVKIARLYYEQEQTQAQISERLRISRQKVQRLLQEAQEEGVVQISIRPLMGVFDELEQALERAYGLREAIIVETTAYHDHATVTREIGVAAADYLLRVIQPHDTLTISWGSSLLGMVNALYASSTSSVVEGIKIVQGLGGLGDPTNETHAGELVRRLASILSGQAVLLPAPGVAGTPAASSAFLTDPHVQQALHTAASADLAFMGIGAPREDSILIQEGTIVAWEELKQLKERGAAGDINLRYFDIDGRLLESELNDRVIGLSLEEIRQIDIVVGVAGGEAKCSAIYGAVRGRLIDVLVTEDVTARRLLEGS